MKAESKEYAIQSAAKWFPYKKGGEFRKWFGNNYYVVNWENDGLEIKKHTLEKYPQLSWDNLGWKISNEADFFKPSVEWSRITSGGLSFRFNPSGTIFDTNGSAMFADTKVLQDLLGLLCSKVSAEIVPILNPTMAFQPGDLARFPVAEGLENKTNQALIASLIELAQSDWDAFETSWDFTTELVVTNAEIVSVWRP